MPVGVEDLYLAADYLVNSYIKDPKNCSKELEFFHERLEDTTLQTQE
jgi:hypothetical protein